MNDAEKEAALAEYEELYELDDDDEEFYEDDDDDDEFYEDDDDDEFYEDDDDDDESDEGEYAERRRFFRGRRRSRGRRGFRRRFGGRRRTMRRRYRRPPRRRFNVRGRRLEGRSGRSVRAATPREVKKVARTITKDNGKRDKAISNNQKLIDSVDKARRDQYKSQTSKLAKFEKSINKRIKEVEAKVQQSALLPMLLSNEPQLKQVQEQGQTSPTMFTDDSTQYFSDNSSLLPLLLLGGGLGGSSSGSSGGGLMSNPLSMILLLKALDD